MISPAAPTKKIEYDEVCAADSASTDAVTLLGRLLSSKAQRRAFAKDRTEWLEQAGANEAAKMALQEIEQHGLETQARVLLSKRFAEAGDNIPETLGALKEEGRELFDAYAETHWPRGHLRHLDDASAFLLWLRAERPAAVAGVEEATLRAHAQFRKDATRLSSLFVAHKDVGPLAGWVVVAHVGSRAWHAFLPVPLPAAAIRWWAWRRHRAS